MKLTETFNEAEIGQPFRVPITKADSAETIRKRVENATGKKFKIKTIKYKRVTRTK